MQSLGYPYKVIAAGTYAGNTCEVGDMLIAILKTDLENKIAAVTPAWEILP